jgi:hypothetical protein
MRARVRDSDIFAVSNAVDRHTAPPIQLYNVSNADKTGIHSLSLSGWTSRFLLLPPVGTGSKSSSSHKSLSPSCKDSLVPGLERMDDEEESAACALPAPGANTSSSSDKSAMALRTVGGTESLSSLSSKAFFAFFASLRASSVFLRHLHIAHSTQHQHTTHSKSHVAAVAIIHTNHEHTQRNSVRKTQQSVKLANAAAARCTAGDENYTLARIHQLT